MTEKVPFDEDSPFFSPSPTTTASDLLRIWEHLQKLLEFPPKALPSLKRAMARKR